MSIEVHVRIRPGVEHSVWSSAETVLYSTVNPNTRYIYNKVHPSNSSNRTIFQGIEAIVHAAYDGKNTTIMAYGQTGSGKTHSMIGVPDDAGIVPRAARLLLELKKQQPGTTVQAYYTEIYNESVRDLLEPQRGELQLHDAPDGGVMFEKRTVTVESFDDFMKMQATAERNRKYGVTNLNDHSSRSHIILTFEVTRPNRSARSVLNLVDLAGSESAARANTDGQTLREGGFINRSLLTLGNVVDAIVEKRPHVPYRAAKLTRVLRTCLGGSGITLILCCVNPSRDNFEQTVSALRFTQRAMKIRNDPVVVLPLPPLFTHQYSEGAKQLIGGMQECSASEYQRGLRDAYMYCNNTCASVVGDFRTNIAESFHGLANAQRLLIAHDHASAIDRIGRLYVQVNEETRQKAQNEAIASDERRRQREAAKQIDERKAKLARLEVDVQEKTCTADTDLAGWEYQLRTARKKEINEMALLISKEKTRRARIFYEWAVCVERIAARCGPRGEDLFFGELTSRQKAAAAEAAAKARIRNARSRTPTATAPSSSPASSQKADVHETAMLADEEGDMGEPTMAEAAARVAALRNPPSKTTALKEMRVRLAQAREEVAQLELAHEMVVDDVKQAKDAQQEKKKKRQQGAQSTNSDHAEDDMPDSDDEDEEMLLSIYEGVPDVEIERQLRQLEDDEKHLMAKARRDVRRESLRRVRESLRLDRAVSSRSAVSGGADLSPSSGGAHGRQAARELYPGEVIEEEEEDRRAQRHIGRGRREDQDDEDDEALLRTQRWPQDQHGRSRTVTAVDSRSTPPPSPSTSTTAATQRLHKTSSTASSSVAASQIGLSVPSSQAEVADYNAEVNNALSVLEQLRHHLLSQQDGRRDGQRQSARPASSSSSSRQPHTSAQRQSPPPQAHGYAHMHTRPARTRSKDAAMIPRDVPLADLFDVSESSQSQGYHGPSQVASEKENTRRGGGAGGLTYGARAYPTKAGLTSVSSGGAARHYEVVVDSDDDQLFDMHDTDPAEEEANEDSVIAGREGSPSSAVPVVGIAARRQYERQHSSEPLTRRAHRGAASAHNQMVERALYAIPSNSQSPSTSMERRSRSRRQY